MIFFRYLLIQGGIIIKNTDNETEQKGRKERLYLIILLMFIKSESLGCIVQSKLRSKLRNSLIHIDSEDLISIAMHQGLITLNTFECSEISLKIITLTKEGEEFTEFI